MQRILICGLLALGILGVVGGLRGGQAAVAASGPCNPTSAGTTGEESQFLALVQQWRNANIPGSAPLQLSGPLNRAAAMFAEYQASVGGLGGHTDGQGRSWVQRELDCGYDSFWSGGSGEGIFARSGSAVQNVGPLEAINGITYQGSGIYIQVPDGFQQPKCAGVAVARNASGTSVAWVLLIAQYPNDQPCPEAGGTTAPPSATGTPSATATATRTLSPTPSPTPTATPNANYGRTVTLYSGWNLVTLPVGPLSDILDTARGCYSAVYQANGSGWLRYLPGAPVYASNLAASNGTPVWILGTDANCGPVRI